MTDRNQPITLTCVSCGAALEITADMDTFACGYCGTQQIVQRRGGTVSLKQIGDAIARVQVGTDRTAAELKIQRLQHDLASAASEQEKLRNDAPWGCLGMVCLGFLLGCALVLNGNMWGLVLVIGCVGIFVLFHAGMTRQSGQIQKRAEVIQRNLDKEVQQLEEPDTQS